MPRQPNITEVRLQNILACLNPVVPLLHELNDAFGTPFVQVIATTTASLISVVQMAKSNKKECIQLMENIHGLLYAIINLHITSETRGSLSPTMLSHLGTFTQTLHKIHTFIESQQGGNKIKHFFRQSEISVILKDCHEGLQQALEAFKMDTTIFNNISEMHRATETMHNELLELVSTLSDSTISDKSSSIYQYANDSQNSSNSFSMLPSRPKIFHGRDSELQHIIKLLQDGQPRIAILGAGGMGKTSLAQAALHHPKIAAKYEQRFFVGCDSATNSIDIAALLGAHLELKPGKDLTKSVLQHFSRCSSSLLILDNLETPWEPKDSRGSVEVFLSLLTDIKHLALIVTMRGAERPAQVHWTHPFLPPLKPLSNNAAWQTFVDIAEDSHRSEDINSLLRLTDNMPLAVDLIAHLASHEGCSSILSRWETEKTSLLSTGQDKRSNLDRSIAFSFSSTRMNSVPGAKDLLSLLSVLPDGISNVELLQSNLAIQDVLRCKATLLGTSLAYTDGNNRLRSLVPIREHVLQFHPPAAHLIEALTNHFHMLLDLYQQFRGQMQMVGKIDQITSNWGNLRQLLQQGLRPDNPALSHAIECTMSLNSFNQDTGFGWFELMDSIPNVLPQPCNDRLEVQYIIQIFYSVTRRPVSNPELLVTRVMSHFNNFTDPSLESKFHYVVGRYYHFRNNPSVAMDFFGKALVLARSSGDTNQQSLILGNISNIKRVIGNYPGSLKDACEGQRLAQLSGNFYEEAKALETEAMCYIGLGDYNRSMILLERGRELLQISGLSGGVLDLDIKNVEAELHLLKSEYADAQKIYLQTLQSTTAEQEPYTYAFCLINIAEIDVMIGTSSDVVHQNLREAETIFKMNGTLESLNIYCDKILADVYLMDKNTEAAKTLFEECLRSSWKRLEEVSCYCLERLADISRWTVTDFNWSSRLAVVYLAIAKTTQARLDLYKALLFLGDVSLFNGDEYTAHNLFIVALGGFTQMGVHRSRALCMLRLGDLAHQKGESNKAVELWRESRPLFERSLQTSKMAQIDARLHTAAENHEPLTHLVDRTLMVLM